MLIINRFKRLFGYDADIHTERKCRRKSCKNKEPKLRKLHVEALDV